MTLLLRLVGPMQSWGTRGRFTARDTNLEPTKSGVIGLIAAALGRTRDESLADLAALEFGVRADREGEFSNDLQSVLNAYAADGSAPKGGHRSTLTYRDYLADAGFLAGVNGDPELLKRIHAALKKPHWAPALGRRSYLPSLPVYLHDGLRPEGLREALTTYPLIAPPNKGAARVRLVLEDPAGSELREDQPLDDFRSRAMGRRLVRTTYIELTSLPHAEGGQATVVEAELWPSQRPRRSQRSLY